MTTNFLFTQSANRKGNASVLEASHSKGVTAQTNTPHGTFHPKGSQGAPSYARATDNTSVGATGGRKQKVMVMCQSQENYKATNTGYMNSDRTNYLK
jgi:hypothetical protein